MAAILPPEVVTCHFKTCFVALIVSVCVTLRPKPIRNGLPSMRLFALRAADWMSNGTPSKIFTEVGAALRLRGFNVESCGTVLTGGVYALTESTIGIGIIGLVAEAALPSVA